MNNLGPEFAHLRAAAKDGIDRGDPTVAQLLFQSYSDEARRTHVFEMKRLAAMKAQAIADVLKTHDPTDLSRLPNPSNDPPPVWQVGKKRQDPLAWMKLSAGEEAAINELRFWWEVTTRAVFSTMCYPMNAVRVDISRVPPDPMASIARHEDDQAGDGKRWRRYLNWTGLQRKPVVRGVPTTVAEMVFSVIIEQVGLRRLSRDYGMSDKSLRKVFGRALRDYWGK